MVNLNILKVLLLRMIDYIIGKLEVFLRWLGLFLFLD